MTIQEAVQKAKQRAGKNPCMWFALCDRGAVTVVSHPILGKVPCCARCAARAHGLKVEVVS